MKHEAPFTIEAVLRSAETEILVKGHLTVKTITNVHQELSRIEPTPALKLDLSQVSRLDTAGAWCLTSFKRRLEDAGHQLQIVGAAGEAESLLSVVARSWPEVEIARPESRSLSDMLEAVGRKVGSGMSFLMDLTSYLGLFLARLARAFVHPREFRFTALVHHCEEVGLRAVPIVALMSFLIGIVLAFQGSTQLRQFGAEVFVVDLIAISILRELGILLTSIIVAGRTASAFTAAIGSMKMREELDAMRTLGIDPAMALFVPRILALLFMLPILGLIANASGLVGGALMSWIDLGISPEMFSTRLVENTDVSHVFVGLIKAPVFALIIGVVGCYAGMRVQSNAESLGRMTSSSVVISIFAVIVADALFSIFFARIGI